MDLPTEMERYLAEVVYKGKNREKKVFFFEFFFLTKLFFLPI